MEALWLGSILTETKREKSFIVIDVFYGDRRRTLLLILNIVTLKYCVFNIERVRCRGTELPASVLFVYSLDSHAILVNAKTLWMNKGASIC